MKLSFAFAANLHTADGCWRVVLPIWDAFPNLRVLVADEIIDYMSEVGYCYIGVVFVRNFP
jgi:hypothetical protein